MIKPNIIFIIIFTLFISCKKNKVNETQSSPVSGGKLRQKFIDTLGSFPRETVFATYAEGINCIYVVQKITGNTYSLTKCDMEINKLLTHNIDLGDAALMQICGSKADGSFYTLTATNKSNLIMGETTQAYVSTISASDSSNCGKGIYDYSFELGYQELTIGPYENTTELKKFNENGEEVWKKTVAGNYFDGNALVADFSGNIYLLAVQTGWAPPIRNQQLSGLVPYYDFQLNQNSFTLYKFGVNGNLLFKKDITHVFENVRWDFEPGLAVSANAIWVSNQDNIFTFGLNGELISQQKPIKNVCYNVISSCVSNPHIENVVVSGNLIYNSSSKKPYYVKVNSTLSNTIEFDLAYKYFAMDNLENIYSGAGSNYLRKISPQGKMLYEKPLYNATNLFQVTEKATFIDKNNSLYAFSFENDLIIAYKFDESGNFQ